MTHTALLRRLSAEDKAALTRRSDTAGLRHLLLYLGVLALCTTGLALRVPFWPLLLLPQGLMLVFLFTLSHECTHQTPFRSRWLNEIVGHLIAPLIALPFVWFRYFHLAHHKFTNDPLRDPELAHGPRPGTRRAWLIYLSGWGYWSGMARTLWANALGRLDAPYLPPRRHKTMRREARIILALYLFAALSLTQTTLLLWLWIIPLLIGQPALRLYLLAEHGMCPPVADMLENSRTTFTNRLVRFLAWNMPYHAEHHSFPAVPFHQLPALHWFTRAHLRATSDGYTEFTQAYLRTLDR
ncbi:fatty acid desaturase [Microbulbifer sp. S227A]|uniref:fatty acid desaturase n=1 Tax=Microbulbifer sp. S227A TaxID=3415131 RepID=UPI003C7C12BD